MHRKKRELDTGEVENQLFQELVTCVEKFVCRLYGATSCTEVNKARYFLFQKRLKKTSVIDLALIPPCQSTLMYHFKRSALIAYMWKQSKSAFVDTPKIADYGWEDDGSVCLAKDIYPDSLKDIYEEDNRTMKKKAKYMNTRVI